MSTLPLSEKQAHVSHGTAGVIVPQFADRHKEQSRRTRIKQLTLSLLVLLLLCFKYSTTQLSSKFAIFSSKPSTGIDWFAIGQRVLNIY